jgi:glutamyl-tRNA reductase
VNVITYNHKNTPLPLRERLHVPQARIKNMLRSLKEDDGIPECVLLSTCNRFELYFEGCPNACGERVRRRIESYTETGALPLTDLHILRGKDATRHLFRVAAGLEAEILGENEILGQLKQAYRLACQADSSGFFLNACFHRAFRVGKRVRSETELSGGGIGYGAAAVEQALSDTGGFTGKSILVIGTGAMCESLLRCLARLEIARLAVAGRSPEKTRQLAEKWGVHPEPFGSLPSLLCHFDIVFSATASPGIIIEKEMMTGRKPDEKPIFLYDLALPRDIAPDLSEVPGIVLRELSDMKNSVYSVLEQREKEIPHAESLIDEAVVQYGKWLRELPAVPSIRRLEAVVETIRLAESTKLRGASLPDDVRMMLEKQCNELTRKMLRAMVGELKHTARNAAAALEEEPKFDAMKKNTQEKSFCC